MPYFGSRHIAKIFVYSVNIFILCFTLSILVIDIVFSSISCQLQIAQVSFACF